jgi:hypothetical protein
MGQKLVEYYEKAKQIGGFPAAGRLSLLTKTPSTQAKTEPDSPENIEKFEKAMQEIKKQFS